MTDWTEFTATPAGARAERIADRVAELAQTLSPEELGRQLRDHDDAALGGLALAMLAAAPPAWARPKPSPSASRLASDAQIYEHIEAVSVGIAADYARALSGSLRECAETLRDRVAMADNGDSVLAKCALDCERASEITGAALIFPKGPDGT